MIEEAFVESYRLLSADNQDVMKEFLKRIEETLGDKTVQLNYDKACRNKKEYAEKRKILLEKYIDGSVEKDIYELTDKDYQKRISEAVAQIEYFGNLLQDNKNLSRRIEEFRRVLEKNQVLEQFDRSVFESMIEKVIVGGIDDEGKKDPYKITFIYKNGFRDSMGQTKSKYGLNKKSGGDVCSHDSVKGEELYSNCEVDAHRDGGIAVAGLGEKQV